MNIVPYTSKWSLVENAQEVHLKFQWAYKVEDNIVGQHPWVLCREYFNETLYYEMTGDKTVEHTWGFRPTEIKRELADDKKAYFLLLFEKETSMDGFKHWLKWLNKFEYEQFDLEFITTIVAEERGNKIIAIEFDRKWFSNSVIMAIYGLILRCMAAKKLPPYSDGNDLFTEFCTVYTSADAARIKECKSTIDTIMPNINEFSKSKRVWPYEVEPSNNIHAQSGVRAFHYSLGYTSNKKCVLVDTFKGLSK